MPLDAYEKLEDKTGRIPIGTFVRRDVPGLEARYAAMREKLRERKGGAA